MSVSTRTAQQSLGIGQIGTTLVVVGLALAMAAAVIFGSATVKKDVAIPAVQGAAPPAFIDHGSRDELNGLNSVANPTEGWKGFYRPNGRGGIEFIGAPEADAIPGLGGAYRPDGRGGIQLIPAPDAYPLVGLHGDPGFAPRPGATVSGTRTPGMRAQ